MIYSRLTTQTDFHKSHCTVTVIGVYQWRRRWKLVKSKAVSLKVHDNMEAVILRFSCLSPYIVRF